MGRETLYAVVEWQRGRDGAPDGGSDGPHGEGTLEITFHGGDRSSPAPRGTDRRCLSCATASPRGASGSRPRATSGS